MKSADAKAPKFDNAWWLKNKARNADVKGDLSKALKTYETERKKFLDLAKSGGKVDVSGIQDALKAVQKEAATAKNDTKLGALQKETKESLANYEKRCAEVVKSIDRLMTSPVMKMKSVDLVRHARQFETYCEKRHAVENYDFLALVLKKPQFDRKVYDTFIADGAPSQVNISGANRNGFDAIAAAIDAGTSPDTPGTWGTAPWARAAKEISDNLELTLVPDFRQYLAGQELKAALP